MLPPRIALLVAMLVDAAPTVHAGKIHLTPWDDAGPFVDYPMIAAGVAIGVPVGLVGGTLSAPFIAAGVAGSGAGTFWEQTKQRGLEMAALSGIVTAVVVGAPFYGVKAVVWDAPASAITRMGRKDRRRPEPPAPAPASPGPPPILDDPLNAGSV